MNIYGKNISEKVVEVHFLENTLFVARWKA